MGSIIGQFFVLLIQSALGILVQLVRSGVAKLGFDAVVGSDVPLGAGVSIFNHCVRCFCF